MQVRGLLCLSPLDISSTAQTVCGDKHISGMRLLPSHTVQQEPIKQLTSCAIKALYFLLPPLLLSLLPPPARNTLTLETQPLQESFDEGWSRAAPFPTICPGRRVNQGLCHCTQTAPYSPRKIKRAGMSLFKQDGMVHVYLCQ